MTPAECPRFVLASASPRRRELLAAAGYAFDVLPATRPEPPAAASPGVAVFVQHAALCKAAEVAALPAAAGRWVLAADTVAESAGGEALGKPRDRADAERILRLLMGTVHTTWTGVCLRTPDGFHALLAEPTRVFMRELAPAALAAFLDSGAWEGKAGAYGIQDRDDPLVRHVEGSFDNVVGLPCARLPALFAAASRWQ